MELAQLAAKPQLIELTIDDKALVKKYGEIVTFHTLDRLPLETFMQLADANQEHVGEMIEVVKPLMLTKEGKPIINKDNVLPTDILIAAITVIVEQLGK